MDAVEYLKTLRRMCKEYTPVCPDCPAFHICGGRIYYATQEKMAEALKAVEVWKEEHPAKTRQSELLKIVPDAYIDTDGNVRVYPCALDKRFKEENCREFGGCTDCARDYWLEEIE